MPNQNKELKRKMGLNIQNERKKAGLLQEDVAKRLGVARETIINYEKGNGISAILIVKLSDIFGCPISNFYLGINVSEWYKGVYLWIKKK